MGLIFGGASAFNQDIGGGDVSSVTDMMLIFDGASLSTANYDALLTGWAARHVREGVALKMRSHP